MIDMNILGTSDIEISVEVEAELSLEIYHNQTISLKGPIIS